LFLLAGIRLEYTALFLRLKRPGYLGASMEFNQDIFAEYITAFFCAWAVGAVIGFVWNWFRSLLGAGD
jgi:hypothetical protein